MLEPIARWLGRNVRLPGVRALILAAYPVGVPAGRHVAGIRTRVDGLKCWVDSRTWIEWNVLFAGSYEPHIEALFECLLEPGDTAVDVGANVGVHTLSLARIVGPSGKVFAFEPNPGVTKRLRQNIELNGFSHVRVDGRALGDRAAQGALRVPAAGSAEACNLGMASLVALETAHDLVEVDVVPFDAATGEIGIDRIDLVKIDVQGYEVPALRGMARAVERFRPAIIFEYEDWAWGATGCRLGDALTMFRQCDYEVWGIESHGGAGFSLVSMDARPMAHVECLAVPRADPRARVRRLLTRRAHG